MGVLLFGIEQGDHGAGGDAGDGDFVGIARQNGDADGAIAAIIGEVDNGLAGTGEEGLGGDTDGVGKAIDDDIHAAGGDAGDGDFVGIARQNGDADGAIAAIIGEVDNGLAGTGEEGLGGDTDG